LSDTELRDRRQIVEPSGSAALQALAAIMVLAPGRLSTTKPCHHVDRPSRGKRDDHADRRGRIIALREAGAADEAQTARQRRDAQKLPDLHRLILPSSFVQFAGCGGARSSRPKQGSSMDHVRIMHGWHEPA
jgi:hypothetical protein